MKKIRLRWTCSAYAHHEHRFRWAAALCGQAQRIKAQVRVLARKLGILPNRTLGDLAFRLRDTWDGSLKVNGMELTRSVTSIRVDYGVGKIPRVEVGLIFDRCEIEIDEHDTELQLRVSGRPELGTFTRTVSKNAEG